ncbi:MAG: hypothetical protein ABSC94_32670 [Polyangiaceae bacterium]|jgi:hypothetical protein
MVFRRRVPKGYVGRNHETIGSDVLSVLDALQALATNDKGRRSGLLEKVLKPGQWEQLQSVHPERWYPIATLLDLMDAVEQRTGRYALVRMGRLLFRRSHEQRVLRTATCGHDIVHAIDQMYHYANRGEQIGGWRVVAFDEWIANLEKTTPHHCAMEEGILAQGLAAVGARAVVSQEVCVCEGADSCLFVIRSAGGRWLRQGKGSRGKLRT